MELGSRLLGHFVTATYHSLSANAVASSRRFILDTL
jgi:hypothetical protein